MQLVESIKSCWTPFIYLHLMGPMIYNGFGLSGLLLPNGRCGENPVEKAWSILFALVLERVEVEDFHYKIPQTVLAVAVVVVLLE